MSEEKNDCSKCLANGVYCQKCYPRPDTPSFSEEKKRTISLEAYLKMQNDWLMLVTKDDSDKGNDHTPEQLITASRGMIDALLKHNNVVVEEG